MPRDLCRQEGSALVTAMLVMMLCLIIGFTTMSVVDVQQGQSRGERERESSFALSEGALNAQIFMLSDQWPSNEGLAYSTRCTQGSASSETCPDPNTLSKAFTGVDYGDDTQWSTAIHDNATAIGAGPDQFYDDAVVRNQPGWDRNGDGLMWVRSQAVVRGKMRTLVALIRAERLDTMFPSNAIVANSLTIGPNGNQTYVTTNGSYVTLRCNNGSGGQMPPSQCKAWGRTDHVGPNATVNIEPGQRPALSPEAIDRARQFARSNNTYYENVGGHNCPNLTGEIVFIERANDCKYTGGWPDFNTAAKPGMVIIGSGTIELTGQSIFYGTIYHVNGSDGVGPQLNGIIVTIQGNGCVMGSVVIDGPGGLDVGSSKGAGRCQGNIQFVPRTNPPLRVYGTAGIVQNSFREIVASN
jgi:hypothetical protein